MKKGSIRATYIDLQNKQLKRKYCYNCVNNGACKYTLLECRKNFYKKLEEVEREVK